ncbi:unnamed protein product [Phyllotreta striolata]|uniref:BTB domain-containing protein n=1 Tax=Phyllotreta striolata TaxID=444603 RepID=A0A9N9TP33_PHYSR|nr:unnamed protein product [Phyllotreta striolata]
MVKSFPEREQENYRFSEGKEGEDCLGNIDLLNLRLFPSENSENRRDRSKRPKNSLPINTEPESVESNQTRLRHSLERTETKLIPNINNLPKGYGNIQNGTPTVTSDNLLLLYSNNERGAELINTEPISRQDFLFPSKKKLHTRVIDVVSEDRMSKSASRNNKLDSGFPFKLTPSGNFKVASSQVVFSTNKLSVLVADPKTTKVCVHPELNFSKKMAHETDLSKTSAMDTIMSQAGFSSLGTLIGNTPVRSGNKEASEYESKQTSEILDPELNLGRLGYTGTDNITWHKVVLPEKKNLYLELYSRITNYTNADCKVYIDNEEFNCHLIVLQCYSELFDAYIAVKKVELPSDKCSAAAFAFIYEWMITGEPSYKELTRDNVLDIFNSAKYLKIKDLVEQCWAFIDHNEVFSEDTAFLLYMDAKEKNLTEVRELMLPRIQGFFLMLVSSQNWLELELDDVKNLLKSNYICVNCEMEVFMSAVRWLKHDWGSRDHYKYEVLDCVRFGNIAPWQLVDIKRNPENPDFMELAKDPKICKMIDDGLAYVIIKYWYGQENDDFQHWNAVLGLQEPPPRNWSGSDKTYFTYREFLIYLDQYRRNQLIEKNKPKMSCDKGDGREARKSLASGAEKNSPRVPTMEEFLSKKKRKMVKLPPLMEQKSPKNHLLRPQAAVIIQRAFRKYRRRKLLRTLNVEASSKKSYEVLKKTKKGVLNMFNVVKNRFEHDQKFSSDTKRNLLDEGSLFHETRETVLVFGGLDPHNPYGFGKNTGKEIFRYMPVGNVWQFVGEMPEPRHHHCSVLYKRRILLAGGSDPRGNRIFEDGGVSATVWSFDPVSRKWFKEEPMSEARKNFGLVGCNLGLFAIGGQGADYQLLNSVEKYDVDKKIWMEMRPMSVARTGFAYAKLKNNIWIAGGISGTDNSIDILDSVETYDIRTNQWTELKRPLRFPRCFSSMMVLSDKLYLIGGAEESSRKGCTSSIGALDLWDERKCEWSEITRLNMPRHGHAVSYLGTQLLIIGGVTTAYGRALSNNECFCTQRETWVRGIACLPTPLAGHAVITLPPASLLTF